MEQNRLYLDLIKRALNNYLYFGGKRPFHRYSPLSDEVYSHYRWKIPEQSQPHTLLHNAQLKCIEVLMLAVLEEGIPGDFIEAGVWRGGAAIFMRAVLQAVGSKDRIVWAADSFEGIPRAEKYAHVEDRVNEWEDRWATSFDVVKANFQRYDLLDDQVRFLKGNFANTLPNAPFNELALVRLDADSYESTKDAMEYLYPKISIGGYIIIDDWHLPGCRRAIEEYRAVHQINEEIVGILDAEKKGPYEVMWKIERKLTADAEV